uniref:AKH1 n=1 Tax=Arundo donax TaxID=35708 RepID=A0A0A9DX49_ARUDO
MSKATMAHRRSKGAKWRRAVQVARRKLWRGTLHDH